jgi:hypothetical protein
MKMLGLDSSVFHHHHLLLHGVGGRVVAVRDTVRRFAAFVRLEDLLETLADFL